MSETVHNGWLERHDDDGGLDEVCVWAPIKFLHVERMDTGAWWMRADLGGGRAVMFHLSAKNQSRTVVSGRVEEDR